MASGGKHHLAIMTSFHPSVMRDVFEVARNAQGIRLRRRYTMGGGRGLAYTRVGGQGIMLGSVVPGRDMAVTF
jgi:hypothetical protein